MSFQDTGQPNDRAVIRSQSRIVNIVKGTIATNCCAETMQFGDAP